MERGFCVIGGGIGGLSAAYELSAAARVTVLEAEPALASHTTGRSAALYSQFYADGVNCALSRLSRAFFLDPPPGFAAHPLQRRIGILFVAGARDTGAIEAALARQAAGIDGLCALDGPAIAARVPVMRIGAGHIHGAVLEPHALRLDVGLLVDGYRRAIRARGGTIRCNARVEALERSGGCWSVTLAGGERLQATAVVNAAGAWGDEVARLAGLAALPLQPLRRTMIVFDPPAGTDAGAWPAIGGISGGYYFLPEAGRLMGSPADETPSTPCDAQAEEYDVALAAHNIEQATTLSIERIHQRWAGLRTFAPDRQPVAGYDPHAPGFFWLVGQGGTGIQTAPALARAAAALALGRPLPPAFEAAGITAAALGPARLVPPSA